MINVIDNKVDLQIIWLNLKSKIDLLINKSGRLIKDKVTKRS